MKLNLKPYLEGLTPRQRESLQRHQGLILWFTGLSGSGKSTLAHAIESRLHWLGCKTFVLDGDNLRQGLCRDLGFSAADRQENIRRVGEVAKLFMESGTIVCTALISPFIADRGVVRLLAPDNFIEIYCQAPLSVCEARDVKGLYQKARRGEISDFTGIDSPYEPPLNPELVLDTAAEPVEASIDTIMALLEKRGLIPTTLFEHQ